MSQVLLILAAIFVISCKTTSSQLKDENLMGAGGSILLKNGKGENQSYAGVGKLKGKMTCTGWLWQAEGDVTQKALFVTNGHCVQEYASKASIYDVVLNKETESEWNVIFNNFADTQDKLVTIKIGKILYSTMKTVDLAVLELEASYEELAKQGIQPFKIAEQSQGPQQGVRVLGFPMGRFTIEERFLRSEKCQYTADKHVVEWYWNWPKSLVLSCKEMYSGSSGSPIFDNGGKVIATVNTTSVEGISQACYLGNPCEVGEVSSRLVPNTSYGSSVYNLGSCLKGGEIQFGESCPLPPPQTLVVEGGPYMPINPALRPTKWNISLSSDSFDSVLFKVGPAHSINCNSTEGTQQAFLDAPILPETDIPSSHGIFSLCLLGQKNGKVQDLRFPVIYTAGIDTKPPTIEAKWSIRGNDGFYRVTPIFQVPEHSSFLVSYGKADTHVCDRAKLRAFRRIPYRTSPEMMPIKFCYVAADSAGNSSDMKEKIISE